MTPEEALDRIAALPRLHLFPDAAEPIEVVTVLDVEAILAEVTPEPGGTLDRDALMEAFRFMPEEYRTPATDWVLALVRPVAGVTLTPEEAALAREAIRYWVMVRGEQGVTALDRHRALAARLETTQ